MTGIAEAKAAAERGRPVVIVAPPAPNRAAALWELLPPEQRAIIVTADAEAATEWAAAAPADRPLHPVTGLARATRLLQLDATNLIAGSVADLAALVARSALKLEAVGAVAVAWPESLNEEQLRLLDTLLAECKSARRVVLAWNPVALAGLLERHAHRAETVGPAEAPSTSSPAQYAVVSRGSRDLAIREALDALNRGRVAVWRAGDPLPVEGGGHDGVICADLPTGPELAQLAAASEPVVLLTAAQLPYLRSIASPLKALRLSGVPDRARDRSDAVRERIAGVLEQRSVDGELAVLEPLFERFDPAEVAAALLALQRELPSPAPGSRLPTPAWVKVFVNVGRKDRATPADLVGALTREVKIPRDAIGKIELKDTFSLVEVSADVADAVVRDLTGRTLKGRRVVARFERR